MKAPKCRLCGHEHYAHQPHVFEDSGSRQAGKAAKSDDVDKRSRLAESKPSDKDADKVVSADPSLAKFDRTAYQREYMRAWRAKRKK